MSITGAGVTTGSTAGLTYTYFTNAAGTTALGTPSAIATSGTYYIRGEVAATGCFDIQPVTVTVNTTPILIVQGSIMACEPELVDLTAPGVVSGTSSSLVVTYWSDPLGTVAITNPKSVSTGTYYLKGNENGCYSSIYPVIVSINKVPVINMPSEITFCPLTDPSFSIEGKGTGGDTYLWMPGNIVSKILPVTVPGIYELTLINSMTNCSTQKDVKVIEECAPEVFFPNVFTPDGDGRDDVYQIFGHHVENFNITIFNRWGEIIFQSNDMEKSWDGYYLDKIMEQGVYPWTVTYEGSGKYKVPHVKQGSVLLKR
ncbi:hypothetical protein MYP_4931 [Sporocytophaga myxococcoides]|uniref:Gliding motility-associated C-terminal domain-containing protein n=1 Tax=Sporocytophaga myxococcoides TaxID=153721 RepID=A0A098LL30_9BACT|nr:hypothetical protein MYP_4931 [Sporocytophaga myxococcoides]